MKQGLNLIYSCRAILLCENLVCRDLVYEDLGRNGLLYEDRLNEDFNFRFPIRVSSIVLLDVALCEPI